MTMLKNAFTQRVRDNDRKRDGGLPLTPAKNPPTQNGWYQVRRSFMDGVQPAYWDAGTKAWYHTIYENGTPLLEARLRNVVGWRD